MYFKENSFSTKNAIVVMANNNTTQSFCTTNGFILNKCENEEWVTISSWGTQEIGLFIPPSGTIEFTIDWVKEYKELEKGRYRLLKVNSSNYDSNPHENLILEFEV